MATEVEDTLQPSGLSGSGFLDTASVKRYKASESLICDDDSGILGYKASGSLIRNDDNGILRLSVQGFGLSKSGRSCWEDVEILRAGHRKVAIQLSDIKNNPQDRKSGHSLVIDLDHVLFVPLYISSDLGDRWGTPSDQISFQCRLQVQENAKYYLLNFKAMQDVFKFQEVFTGFSVQIHIPHVEVHLSSVLQKSMPYVFYRRAIQLWRKVPTQRESFNVPTDAPHDQSHAWIAEGERARSKSEDSLALLSTSTTANMAALLEQVLKDKKDIFALENGHLSPAEYHRRWEQETQNLATLLRAPPTTASNIRSDLSNSSTIETPASSLLVFGGTDIMRKSGEAPCCWSIPLDGRISSARRCRCGKSEGTCKHITFGEETDPASYWRKLSPRDPLWKSSAIKPSAIGLNVSRSLTATQSSFSRRSDTIRQDLNFVELEFRSIEDKMDFKAAYDALRRLTELDGFRLQNRLLREETPPSEYQSPTEQGSLGRKYESAAIDAENMIPTVLQKGDNTEITPFYRAKAEKGDSLTLVPHSPPALAGDASSHIGETVRLAEDERRNRGLEFGERRPIESVERARRRQQREEEERYRRRDEARRRGEEEDRYRRRDEARRRQEEGDIERLRQPQDRMAEQERLDRLRRAKIPRQPRHHPPFSSEHSLDKVSESIESGPSAPFVRETLPALGDEEQLLEIEKQVNRKIQRASIETSTKREQWRRRICRRIVVFMLWKREQHICVPNELWSSPASFEFINVLEMSTFDKAKGLFETYSGREWNWWPFSAPVKPLESGRVRIRWQCACGDQRWTNVSKYLARKCQALVNENPTAAHERGNAASQSESSAASHSQLKGVVPGSFPSDASQLPGDASNICSTVQASHIQNTYNNANPKDLYVLFCVYQKSQILHSQILATGCQNDEVFFENLRQEYRRLRGFFRFWFSPLQFSHCDFVKFTRFYVNELAKVGHSLPSDMIYEYNPRPPGPHDDPPISPHEFRRRFYTPLGNPCGRCEALERIPKRQKRFQVNLHVDGREDMWGLLVELQPCFLIVLMWQIAITGGGWAFMGWWLSRHQGDLQNAAMPITLIATAMMALWAPIGKGMRETL